MKIKRGESQIILIKTSCFKGGNTIYQLINFTNYKMIKILLTSVALFLAFNIKAQIKPVTKNKIRINENKYTSVKQLNINVGKNRTLLIRQKNNKHKASMTLKYGSRSDFYVSGWKRPVIWYQ